MENDAATLRRFTAFMVLVWSAVCGGVQSYAVDNITPPLWV